MIPRPIKRYLFASDFDQTLSFNDSGFVLADLLGIPADEFLRKASGMADLSLVQQGAELAYLLLHDPAFRHCRREHLYRAGKLVPLKQNIQQLYPLLRDGIDGYQFDFFVLSAAPVEIVQSALEGIVPRDHIFGTEFQYNGAGEIERVLRATAGYGKVARLEQLQSELQIGPAHIIYAGDGSSDLHAMLHVNDSDGLTIAVSESRNVGRVAKRTVLSSNALSMLLPIFENVVGWQSARIREFFEANGFLVQDWGRVHTDWLTLRPAEPEGGLAESAAV
jgi:2-hydroxy-3-keto-5-methylthiopentenyl-1-phosphate phosphatase